MAGRRLRGVVGGVVALASVGVVAVGLTGATAGSASVGEVVATEPGRSSSTAAPPGDRRRRDLSGEHDGPTSTSSTTPARARAAGPTTAATPATTTTTATPPPPTPVALAPAPPPVADLSGLPPLGWGDRGDHVVLLQARLNQLGFRTSDEAGYFGSGTWSAVMALQKFEGLDRTGTMDAPSWQRLYAPTGLLPPSRPATGIEVEVDLERQVLIVLNAEAPQQVTIMNTSTGGEYTYYNEDGSEDYAWTPPGRWQGYRRYDGVEVAPLGTLYRPIYFLRGWAVHGSPSVPPYPASHGCVRLSYDDMDWLWDRAPDDLKVTVRTSMQPAAVAAEEAQWQAEAEAAAAEERAAAEAAAAEERAAAEAAAAEARAAAQQAALAAFIAGVDQARVAAGLEPLYAS